MTKLTIRQLTDLVGSEVDNPEARLERIFEWEHSRRTELAKWVLTAAAALFVPVALSGLKGDFTKGIPGWWIVAALFGAVLLAVLGMVMLYRANRLQHVYIASMSLLGDIKRIAPFIHRYREEIDRRWKQ